MHIVDVLNVPHQCANDMLLICSMHGALICAVTARPTAPFTAQIINVVHLLPFADQSIEAIS
eukprot:gene6334-biopygen7841